MDPIKEAFFKIKEEMLLLKNEINMLNSELKLLKSQINLPTTPTEIPADAHTSTTTPTENPTVPQEIGGLEYQKEPVSTGNRGVPTDNSPHRQTTQQTGFSNTLLGDNNAKNTLLNINYTIESLDAIKKDLRFRVKRLTPQEMLVFSTLYTLETQGFEEITYKIIANNLNLSESSIRDYTNKILHKGIPLIKSRLNNKKIVLKISPDLKKIANLSTIMQLREM